MKRKQQSNWSTAFACILGIFYIFLLVCACWDWNHMDLGVAKLEMRDIHRQAIGLFISYLRSIGATTLALIGSLWAFVIFTNGVVEITNRTEMGIFLLTNIVLASSYVIYFFGENFIVGMMFSYGHIDLEASQVLFWTDLQRHLFLLGILCLVVTTVICRRSREVGQ